jgi:hypothetical protein
MAVRVYSSDDERVLFPTNVPTVKADPEPGAAASGIVSLDPYHVTSVPAFTEEATLMAMRNLGFVAEDLVQQDPGGIADVALRVQTMIELDRRRLDTFQKILAERSRLLSLPSLAGAFRSPARTVRKKKKVPKRRPAAPELPALAGTRITITWRRSLAAAQDDARRRGIRLAARARLEQNRAGEAEWARRLRERRNAAEDDLQRQARAYMRIQERKQRAFEAENRRRLRVYAAAVKPEKRKNGLSALRRKFLGSGGPPIQFDTDTMPPPMAVPDDALISKMLKPATIVARSYQPRVGLTVAAPIVAASHDPGRRGSRLPIIGKGKTRIPCFRR